MRRRKGTVSDVHQKPDDLREKRANFTPEMRFSHNRHKLPYKIFVRVLHFPKICDIISWYMIQYIKT